MRWEEDNWETDSLANVSYCIFNDRPALRCYRASTPIDAPPQKVLDIIMSVTERSQWDDLFANGTVTKAPDHSVQLAHLNLWIPRYYFLSTGGGTVKTKLTILKLGTKEGIYKIGMPMLCACLDDLRTDR